MQLIEMLPRYYQKSPPVAELERVLGLQTGALRVSELDTLDQLWVDTATWGLALWEAWVGLPAAPGSPASARRSRIKARLRGQGTTTAGKIAAVVASFGFDAGQVRVAEDAAHYAFQVVISGLAAPLEAEDAAEIQAAVDEIKPAHLSWSLAYEMAELSAGIQAGGVFWTIRETVLPAMQEG